MIQASLHSYYEFISGQQFFTRLNLKDFDMNASIETEIIKFRKYLIEIARLSENTIVSQCNTVKSFLYNSFPQKDFAPEKLTADIVEAAENIKHFRLKQTTK